MKNINDINNLKIGDLLFFKAINCKNHFDLILQIKNNSTEVYCLYENKKLFLSTDQLIKNFYIL